MDGTRAKLRNLFLGLALLPSSFAGPWPTVAAAQSLSPQGRQVQAGDLVKLGYGGKFPASQFRDPDLDLKVNVSLSEFYGQNSTHGETIAVEAAFFGTRPDLLSPSYLILQSEKFGYGISIRAYFKAGSPAIPLGIEDRAATLHHEGTHPLDEISKAVKEIIEDQPSLDDVLNEPIRGFGPALGKIIADGDPARAARMRTDVQAILSGQDRKKSEASYPEYGLLATERVAYLSEILSGAIRSHVWKRLPATRAELYAAAYNLFGGIKLPSKPQDEVSQTLASPEGRAALKEFPSFVAFQNNGTASALFLIRRSLTQLTPAERIAYYEQVLPQDYGDIQEEVLGNPHGRTDLGLKASPNYGVAFAYHVIRSHYEASDSWDPATYARVAKEVEPEVFLNVLKVAVQNGNVKAQAALYGTFEERFGPNAPAQKAEIFRLTVDARDAAKKFTPPNPADAFQRDLYFASIQQSIDFMTQSGFGPTPPPAVAGAFYRAVPESRAASPTMTGSRDSSIAYLAR